MLIIKILSFLALLGSVVWFIYAPDFEPAIAIVTSISAFILAYKQERKSSSQTQTVNENAVGIQSAGNVTTGDIKIKKGSCDAK